MKKYTFKRASTTDASAVLRSRFQAQQQDLMTRFQSELSRIPRDDVVMHTRIRHKYRQLGLQI